MIAWTGRLPGTCVRLSVRLTVRLGLLLGIGLGLGLGLGVRVELGAGLIIEFASVRGGLIIAVTQKIQQWELSVWVILKSVHSAMTGPCTMAKLRLIIYPLSVPSSIF